MKRELIQYIHGNPKYEKFIFSIKLPEIPLDCMKAEPEQFFNNYYSRVINQGNIHFVSQKHI